MHQSLPIMSFASQKLLNDWLAAQPSDAPRIRLRVRKKASTVASVTKAEAIDSGLCHGWIDGQIDKYDIEAG